MLILARITRLLGRWSVVAIAILGTIWLGRAFESRRLPELRPWHTIETDGEFSAERHAQLSFTEYQALERELLAEVSQRLAEEIVRADQRRINRFSTNSPAHPENLETNWNLSYRSLAPTPRGGVLLLHGASDSPYSMRGIAELLQANGFNVMSLRLPGNGIVPAGLTSVSAEDWIALTRLGVGWLREDTAAPLPIYIAGYSAGAALALNYTLDALSDESLELPDGLILLSPAIGITAFARFASWDLAVSWIPYFERFAWASVLPEFDPFKFNSFPKNAGDIVYRLTRAAAGKIARLRQTPAWQRLPPILTFQSAVDSTVDTGSVLKGLYDLVQSPGHELVMFDLNRDSVTEPFLRQRYGRLPDGYALRAELPFDYTIVTNASRRSTSVIAQRHCPRDTCEGDEELGLSWPLDTYSLSHVAIPFAPGDPLYGVRQPDEQADNRRISELQPRGERGVLIMPLDQLMRLRYNPFFPYMAERIVDFVGATHRAAIDSTATDRERSDAQAG